MDNKRLEVSLFLLRIGVFIVMFIWTLDKFVRPEHTAAIFQNFYMFSGISEGLSFTIGIIQGVIVFSFLVGFMKKFSYGAVFFLHFISTISSYQQYINPWEGANILFFAAWPMLSAIAALYILRDFDNLLTLAKDK